MKRGSFAAFLLLIVAIISLVHLHIVSIETPRNEQVLYVSKISPGDRFSLSFIHSVEHCPVRDHIRIDDACRMVTYATEFWSSRTGLPYAPFGDETFTVEGNHYRIGNMNRVIPAIFQWVDKQYDNRLVFDDGREIRLPDLAGNTLLKLSVLRASLFWYVYMRLILFMK
ncbi:MAG: DUF1850 domain-containing protein [Deltaproteobacteria bacterium]|nr:DUF1850 domain-containing protein [Deltaproteobacteria bacterium]